MTLLLGAALRMALLIFVAADFYYFGHDRNPVAVWISGGMGVLGIATLLYTDPVVVAAVRRWRS